MRARDLIGKLAIRPHIANPARVISIDRFGLVKVQNLDGSYGSAMDDDNWQEYKEPETERIQKGMEALERRFEGKEE